MRKVWIPLVLLLLLSIGWRVTAQTDFSAWSAPTNISRSDAATSPILLVDNSGLFHVIWQDEFAGFVYTSGDGAQWGEPQALRLPFTEPAYSTPDWETFAGLYQPEMLIDAEDVVHAFWVDFENNLRYSRAALQDVPNGSQGWTAPARLAQPVAKADVTVDENGRLHMTYIRTANTDEEPSGLYYRQSQDGGRTWSDPTLMAASAYFRTVTAADAHIVIETAGAAQVYVAWDNRALDTLFVLRSPDNGASWTRPQTIAQRGPDDPPELVGPSQINVFAMTEEEVHLSWWAGDPDDPTRCLLYHRWTANGGGTWQDAQVVLPQLAECPQRTDFFLGQDGLLFLLTVLSTEAYMQAWNGEQWTSPEVQSEIAFLIDPATYRDVQLGCHQTAVTQNNDLIVAGCGQGNTQDIWVLQRPLGALGDWFDLFAPTPIWENPRTIVESPVRLLPPAVVHGGDGRIHAFWSQSNDPVTLNRIEQPITTVGRDIYYARLNAGRWSAPRPVLASPMGKADDIAVAAGANNGLYITWSSGQDGGLYFSRAVADRASSATEWIEPLPLPAPQMTAVSPDIMVDDGDTIYIAYTIPFNEGRGVYLVQSEDDGNTWSEIIQIFDGEAADWPLVGPATLGHTADGQLHVMWTRGLSDGNEAQGMVYARSTDYGFSWSEPVVVTEETVVWSRIIGVEPQSVHRIWLGIRDGRTLLWHDYSLDNGLSWSQETRVSDPAKMSGPAAVMVDAEQVLHLLQLAETDASELMLQEWLWNGERWDEVEPLNLDETAVNAGMLSAVTAPEGSLGIIYGALLMDLETAVFEDAYFYTSRQLGDEVFVAPPEVELTPTATPGPIETPVPTVEPTPTVSLPQVVNNESAGLQIGPIDTSSSTGGILVGVIPAALIAGLVFGGVFWFVRRK